MKFGKIVVASLLVPALVSPAFAAGDRAVRPSIKAVSAAPTVDRALTIRRSTRAGADTEAENQLFLAGLPLLALVAITVAVIAVAAVALDDEPSSPGS